MPDAKPSVSLVRDHRCRDCAQYSAGSRNDVYADSQIDGFASGIGNYKAVVLLEPDGLGIIPWYNPLEIATHG